MRRTVSALAIGILCVCILIGFIWYGRSLNAQLDEANGLYDSTKLRLTALEGEQTSLKAQLEMVGTDAFIENQARTVYGYMMPDEIRFVITNPEALYGDEQMPSR